MCFFFNVEDPQRPTAALVARPTAVAGLFLLRVHEQPELRSDGRKSNLRADTVGQEPPSTVQVGEREYYYHCLPLTIL